MNKFLERLQSDEILVADGATGSNLQKMGLKPGMEAVATVKATSVMIEVEK